MQRPTRILVFGILCLVVGVFSGMKNTVEGGVAILGPDFVDKLVTQQRSQGIPESYVQALEAERRALTKPAYRVGQGVESFVSVVMAGVLIFGGIFLLCDRLPGVRLSRYWAYYALFSSSVTVVLQVRFVVPELSSGPEGGAVFGVACMLPFLWLVPLLILIMLSRPVVMNYLRWKAQNPAKPMSPATFEQGGPEHAQRQPAASAAPAELIEPPIDPPAPRVGVEPPYTAKQTWRDDPWNDSTSK